MTKKAANGQPVNPAVDFGAGIVAGELDQLCTRVASVNQTLLAVLELVADIAGAAGLIVGQPFDVVKVRYQTPAFMGRYNSIIGAFRESRDRGACVQALTT